MPEIDHVRGIEGHPELAGPPHDPPSATVPVPPWDELDRGVPPVGDEDATSRRYFIETVSPELKDIVEREDDSEEGDD